MNIASLFISAYLKKFQITSGGLVIVLFALYTSAVAQPKVPIDSMKMKVYKNTVKLNLTSWIFYENGFQLNYERLLSKKRSFTIYGGYIEFPMPPVIDNSSLRFPENRQSSGFAIGADYRFYLAKENKYDAPRGVYLAPFVSYYHFSNQRAGRDTVNQSKVTLSTAMDFLNIGGELGYQFIIKRRFVIDCVLLGPAVSSYYFSVKLNGNTSGGYDEDVQAIIDALKNKYPLFNDLSSGAKVSTNGVSSFWSFGFRYAIHIGYRF